MIVISYLVIAIERGNKEQNGKPDNGEATESLTEWIRNRYGVAIKDEDDLWVSYHVENWTLNFVQVSLFYCSSLSSQFPFTCSIACQEAAQSLYETISFDMSGIFPFFFDCSNFGELPRLTRFAVRLWGEINVDPAGRTGSSIHPVFFFLRREYLWRKK